MYPHGWRDFSICYCFPIQIYIILHIIIQMKPHILCQFVCTYSTWKWPLSARQAMVAFFLLLLLLYIFIFIFLLCDFCNGATIFRYGLHGHIFLNNIMRFSELIENSWIRRRRRKNDSQLLCALAFKFLLLYLKCMTIY